MILNLLHKWIRNPLQYGTITESSRGLSNLMLGQVPPNSNCIVEFGAGTGPITQVLAEQFGPKKIHSFELDPELANKVKIRAPGVHVYSCDVRQSLQVLPKDCVGQVDAIVSSLPLLNLSEEINREILLTSLKLLKPEGVFLQYTYMPFIPPSRVHRELGLETRFVGVHWKNVPPAYVWVFRRYPESTMRSS